MNILIAEDEALESKSLKMLLLKYYEKYIDEITIVSNGEKAVEYLKNNPNKISLLFIDIQMPVLNGVDACTLIRTFDERVKIVMLTAYADFQYAQKSIKNRVFDYITKPYSLDTLRECMEKIIPSTGIDAHQKKIEDVKNYIHSNYMNEISLDSIAQFASISRFHLSRTFKSIEGISINHYIQNIRINQAKKLLLEGKSATEVAYSVGFNDPAYFGKLFKHLTGITPSSYGKAKKS